MREKIARIEEFREHPNSPFGSGGADEVYDSTGETGRVPRGLTPR
jgi:hypothetical protein